MCPTAVGRIHTRVATIVLPALLGTTLALVTGREDWIVLVGVYLLLGVALDAGLYAWLFRYQPPWMTFVLALGELGLLYVLANVLELALSPAEAIGFYWASWLLAIFTKIVLLPIISLTYLESSLEFRRNEWSIPVSQAPLPVLAATPDTGAGPGPLVRLASGEHAAPLKPLPSPSEVISVPAEVLRAPTERAATRVLPALARSESRGDVPMPDFVASEARRVPAREHPSGPTPAFTPTEGRVKRSAARRLEATVISYGVVFATAAAIAILFAQR